jgi:hypothetical protein
MDLRLGSVTSSSDDDDAPVGLDGSTGSEVVPTREVRRHDPVTAEGDVEAAIGLVPDGRESATRPGCPSRRDHLPVRLDHEVRSEVLSPREVRDDLAVITEGVVEGPIRVVAGQRELAVPGAVGDAGDDDLPVQLDR